MKKLGDIQKWEQINSCKNSSDKADKKQNIRKFKKELYDYSEDGK